LIFDTDIFIRVQRGHKGAARLIEKDEGRRLSAVSYMELLQCAQNKKQLSHTRDFLKDFGFQTLPLTENIGHRAAVYIEEYGLSHGLRGGDAIVAATAVEHDAMLCTSSGRHFRPIKELKLKLLRP
jgi:predicted nucleic acid-binding protein